VKAKGGPRRDTLVGGALYESQESRGKDNQNTGSLREGTQRVKTRLSDQIKNVFNLERGSLDQTQRRK